MKRLGEITLSLNIVVTIVAGAIVGVFGLLQYIESSVTTAVNPVEAQTNQNTSQIATMGAQLTDISNKIDALYGYYLNKGLITGTGRAFDISTSSNNFTTTR